jgi:hypothetical protein
MVRTDERRWMLLRSFYRSYSSFHALFDEYERRVLAFTTKYRLDRKELKLRPEELLSLFDSHALLALRDGDLASLREISHKLFRRERPDPFDSHVSNIYHEVSILKEEEWTLREQAADEDPKEYERYYREVNIYYPKRLRHVRNLYEKARKRLEKLLPAMSRETIVVRSAYLFGGDLFRDVYDGGLEEFYRHLYPDAGALAGYTVAADSFYDGGFGREAAEAYEKALAAAGREMDRAAKDGGRTAEETRALETQRRSLEKRRDKALALA